MRHIFNSFCAHKLKHETNNNNKRLESNEPKKKQGDPQLWRDIVAYWILGLCVEFGYVVIISAAHDILHGFGQSSNVIFAVSKTYRAAHINFNIARKK